MKGRAPAKAAPGPPKSAMKKPAAKTAAKSRASLSEVAVFYNNEYKRMFSDLSPSENEQKLGQKQQKIMQKSTSLLDLLQKPMVAGQDVISETVPLKKKIKKAQGDLAANTFSTLLLEEKKEMEGVVAKLLTAMKKKPLFGGKKDNAMAMPLMQKRSK